jgi:hypothetical protein
MELMNDSKTVTLPLSAAPMEEVRWGLIGLGVRGLSHLETLLQIEGARITAVCDNHAPYVERALSVVEAANHPKPLALGSDEDADSWRRLLDCDDVDAVIISTAWEQHAIMGIEAMRAGKHVFLEVPAAVTIDECHQLVETCEATGKHCMMLENANYGREELMILNMVRQGVFGEILHAEGAYIHELRKQMFEDEHGTGSWRTYQYANQHGNLYPTHGVGPLAHCMDVNRGDYFDHIVSMSSPARGRELYAREHFDASHQWNRISTWHCGDINTSIIKLMSGKTMMLQWDETSPRPYSRLNFLQGTRGAFGGYPNRIAVDYDLNELPEAVRASTPKKGGRTDYHVWDTHLEPWFYSYEHPIWKEVGKIAQEHGGHGGKDYIMFWRVQQCLLNGKPMDQSVYDAALWSSIVPLSSLSVQSGSAPQKFPDFTNGKWKSTPPIEVEDGE